MQNHDTLLALTTVERAADLQTSTQTAIALKKQTGELQKHVGKVLTAMIFAKECEAGDIGKHAFKITGVEIRESMQDIYGLRKVFTEIIEGKIDNLTEADYDAMDSSKLALLSTFLEKNRDKLPEAVEAAKTGTAKDMRALKPKSGKDTGGDGKPPTPENPGIPVGFVATDIGATDPLVRSVMAKDRFRADLADACTRGDASAIAEMANVFGNLFALACEALGESGVSVLESIAAKNAQRTASPASAPAPAATAMLEAAAA